MSVHSTTDIGELNRGTIFFLVFLPEIHDNKMLALKLAFIQRALTLPPKDVVLCNAHVFTVPSFTRDHYVSAQASRCHPESLVRHTLKCARVTSLIVFRLGRLYSYST
jgi:hypothetical protein